MTLNRKKSMQSVRRQQLIFYSAVVALPFIHFLVFYLYVNFNSFLLAFQKYDAVTGVSEFAAFDNFKKFIAMFSTTVYMPTAFKNSAIAFVASNVVVFPIALLTANYTYKKCFLSETFKVILIIPDMITSLVVVTIYKYFVDLAPVEFFALFGVNKMGFLANPDTILGALVFYTIFNGLNSGILVYLGAMRNIPESYVEAAALDGITPLKEFIYITLPSLWPLLTVYIYGMVSGFFGNSLNAFTFFETQADYSVYTIGYYMQISLMDASTRDYGLLAAMGMLMTLVAAPLTFLVKWALEKYGPTTD